MAELTNSEKLKLGCGLYRLIHYELKTCANNPDGKNQIKMLGELIDYGAVKGYLNQGVTQELIHAYNDLVVERGYINDLIINNEITKIQEEIDKNLK